MIHHYPSQPQLQVETILSSASTVSGAPVLRTLRLRYPRIIHAEVKTHRIFELDGVIREVIDWPGDIMGDKNLSRNARSSRAVPVKTMIDEVRNSPFVPWHWGKNQKGMQAGEDHNATVRLPIKDWVDIYDDGCDEHERDDAWLWAKEKAVEAAEAFDDAGYHKQICNRLLEPFMWIDVLITATEWSNFMWLRDHKDAEPHLQDLARLVGMALEEAPMQTLKPGEWHLPYVEQRDWDYIAIHKGVEHTDAAYNQLACKLSAARCARISYKPFDGDSSYEAELARYDSLVSSDRIHASPVEHQATPDHDRIDPRTGKRRWKRRALHGNFTGWIQNRKTIAGENHA